MTLRCIESLALKFHGRTVWFEPGNVFTVSPAQAARVLARFPSEVEVIVLPLDLPLEPLMPGWLVCYRDRQGRLCGGCDDRQHGTVKACTWTGAGWMVTLPNGDMLALNRILSVGKTDAAGAVVAAWTTRAHGYAGAGDNDERQKAVKQ